MSRKINYEYKPTPLHLQIIAGTVLGDSSIGKSRGSRNCYLSCYHSEKQLEYLKHKHRLLEPFTRPIQLCAYTDKRNGKTYHGGRFHTVSAPIFTGLYRCFYPGGQKQITTKGLRFFTEPIALAMLIGDDGSWDKAGVQVATKQFSLRDNELLCQHITSHFAVDPYVVHSDYYSIRFGAKDVERLRVLCYPHLPESMHYKFGPPDYKTTLVGKEKIECPVCCKTFLAQPANHRKYCSRRCANIGKPKGWQMKRKVLHKTCPVCKKQFRAYSSRHTYCSKKCWRQHYKQ